jgi:hypothetical protein
MLIGPPAGAAVAAGAWVAWALLDALVVGVLLADELLAGVLLEDELLAGVLLPLELLAGALLQAARTGVTTANTAIDLSNRRRVMGESLNRVTSTQV